MALDRGAAVRQIVRPIQGEITQRRFSEDAGAMEYLVAYTDAAGNPAERWFLETELEVQP